MIGDRWVGGMSWRDWNIWFFTSINIEQEEQLYTRSWGGGMKWFSNGSMENHLEVRQICLKCGQRPNACNC